MKTIAAIVLVILSIGCATAGRLPPNTSIEGTIAVRGDQVVQALRQVLPTLKPYVCLPSQLPGTLCIKPTDADRVAQHLIIAFTAAEGLATALKVVDDARTAGEREVGMARVREYVRSHCKRPSLEPRSCLVMSRLG